MVFAYVPATGTAGINTQLLFFAHPQSLFLLMWKGACFMTQNPGNGELKTCEKATQTRALCLALLPDESV